MLTIHTIVDINNDITHLTFTMGEWGKNLVIFLSHLNFIKEVQDPKEIEIEDFMKLQDERSPEETCRVNDLLDRYDVRREQTGLDEVYV